MEPATYVYQQEDKWMARRQTSRTTPYKQVEELSFPPFSEPPENTTLRQNNKQNHGTLR